VGKAAEKRQVLPPARPRPPPPRAEPPDRPPRPAGLVDSSTCPPPPPHWVSDPDVRRLAGPVPSSGADGPPSSPIQPPNPSLRLFLAQSRNTSPAASGPPPHLRIQYNVRGRRHLTATVLQGESNIPNCHAGATPRHMERCGSRTARPAPQIRLHRQRSPARSEWPRLAASALIPGSPSSPALHVALHRAPARPTFTDARPVHPGPSRAHPPWGRGSVSSTAARTGALPPPLVAAPLAAIEPPPWPYVIGKYTAPAASRTATT
jgi:hypothetical protein